MLCIGIGNEGVKPSETCFKMDSDVIAKPFAEWIS